MTQDLKRVRVTSFVVYRYYLRPSCSTRDSRAAKEPSREAVCVSACHRTPKRPLRLQQVLSRSPMTKVKGDPHPRNPDSQNGIHHASCIRHRRNTLHQLSTPYWFYLCRRSMLFQTRSLTMSYSGRSWRSWNHGLTRAARVAMC